MKHVVITANSVWLVEEGDDGALLVVDRATFGSPNIEEGARFSGPVTGGMLAVGSRLIFTNTLDKNVNVMIGAIKRIVAFEDLPKRELPENMIDLTPSFAGLWPVIGDPVFRSELRLALRDADLLVALVDMGRVSQADLRAAHHRVTST